MSGVRTEIDVDERAREAGYRNFTSFYFSRYMPEDGWTLQKCGKILDVSASKVRTAALGRGWKVKTRSSNPKPFKRKLYIWQKVKERTPFIFPWCAIYYYYVICTLTTYEVAKVLGISQASVLKLMNKYGIERRKSGVKYESRGVEF